MKKQETDQALNNENKEKSPQHVSPPEGDVEGLSHIVAGVRVVLLLHHDRICMHSYSWRQGSLLPEAKINVHRVNPWCSVTPSFSASTKLQLIRAGVWNKSGKKYSFHLNAPGVKSAPREESGSYSPLRRVIVAPVNTRRDFSIDVTETRGRLRAFSGEARWGQPAATLATHVTNITEGNVLTI